MAHRLRPNEKLTLSQWAERFMPHYDPELLPFLAEIMDACSDPETGEVGDMGPSQGGKSLVGEAFMGFSIHQDPQPFLMTQPDKIAAETFIKLRVNTLMDRVPVLRAELAPSLSADNMHLKLFKGMYLGAAWPVKSHFRGRPYCRGWLDDFDAISDDIEGEGDAVGLLESRFAFFKGQDTKLVSSSPGKDKGGIEAFVAVGTDERLQPVCPTCGDRIEVDTIRDLKFDDTGGAELAAETAHVVCPAHGCILEPEARHELLRSLRDLPNRGFVARNRAAGKYRRTFRRDGLLSLNSWEDLARQWRAAQIAWADLQDEGPLRTFYNTKAGKNYRSILSGEKPIESATLRDRREAGWKLGTVPRGPKVLVLVIDVQRDRFECAVIGIAAGREMWLVDRFAIDVLDDGLTGVAPFIHKEHWKVLLPLFDRRYPLLDRGKMIGEARILSVTVDTGGSDKAGDQATEGAKYFWEEARSARIHPEADRRGVGRAQGLPLVAERRQQQPSLTSAARGGGARGAQSLPRADRCHTVGSSRGRSAQGVRRQRGGYRESGGSGQAVGWQDRSGGLPVGCSDAPGHQPQHEREFRCIFRPVRPDQDGHWHGHLAHRQGHYRERRFDGRPIRTSHGGQYEGHRRAHGRQQ